jgi:excisionase family DNA binding protein
MTKTPMTAIEVARKLGVRLNYVYVTLREGRLRGTRDERNEWMVDPSSVEEYATRPRARKVAST